MKSYRAIADFYDAEYAEREDLQRDVPFALSLLPAKKQSVLMLACGTGRAAIPFAMAGHSVVGVDIAKDMLAIASEKRDAAGIAEKRVQFFEADLLQLQLDQQFDSAVLLFNSLLQFTTLEQLDMVIANTASHLKRGGRFVIDIFNPSYGLLAEDDVQELDPVIFYSPRLKTSVQRLSSVRRTRDPLVRRVRMSYAWHDASGKRREKNLDFEITHLTHRELTMLLARGGFEAESLHGDYDGSPVENDSPRIIGCFRRS